MANFIQTIFLRWFDWFTRPRTAGVALVGAGVALLAAPFSIDWLGQLDYFDGKRRFSLKTATGSSLPQWMAPTAYVIGGLLVAVGALLVVVDFRRTSRRVAVVLELRGLHSSPDTPAKDANLRLPGQKIWHPIDFRPKSESELVDPSFALQRVTTFKNVLQTYAGGRDPSDVSVAVGGLAAVPALFLAGVLLDDESQVTLFDWQRDKKRWQLVDGPDDGKRMMPADYSQLPAGATEAVLAVSLSYQVDLPKVQATFPSLGVVELRAEEVAADRYWSSEKQEAVVSSFRAVVQELLHRGVTRIHLLLAAPASLSIRLGMAYDRRLLPELLVYQYERSSTPPYPWAFAMPTHGKPDASLVETAKSAGVR
jgi:hypothetical protein